MGEVFSVGNGHGRAQPNVHVDLETAALAILLPPSSTGSSLGPSATARWKVALDAALRAEHGEAAGRGGWFAFCLV